MHFYIQEHLIFYIPNIHTNSIKKKEHISMSQQLEIYTYCSINKQYIEVGIKMEESLLD